MEDIERILKKAPERIKRNSLFQLFKINFTSGIVIVFLFLVVVFILYHSLFQLEIQEQ